MFWFALRCPRSFEFHGLLHAPAEPFGNELCVKWGWRFTRFSHNYLNNNDFARCAPWRGFSFVEVVGHAFLHCYRCGDMLVKSYSIS